MKIFLRGQSFTVDAVFEESHGVYGKVFWDKVGSSNYEVDTFTFIEKSYSKGKRTFIDIGAATGCMTLFAASLGYKVIALEPQSTIFEALKRNVSLNPNFSSKIECLEVLLISGYKAMQEREFFTLGTEGPLATDADTLSSLDALDLLSKNIEPSGYSLKIDIEGAEFSLLRDRDLLQYLNSNGSILFLSFHPGFQKPLPRQANVVQKFSWRVKTFFDTYRFINLLSTYAKLTFKNEDQFLSRIKVLKLILQGERDFTLYF